MNGAYVIENKNGQVVRVLNWEGDEASVIFRQDTKRVETRASTEDLEEKKIPFTVISSVSKEKVRKSPVKILDLGILRFLPEVQDTPVSLLVSNDDSRLVPVAFKWTAGTCLGLLLLLLGLGQLLKTDKTLVEPQTVTIETRTVVKQKVVTPHKQKIPPPPTVTQKAPKKAVVSKVAQIKPVKRAAKARKQVSINNVGDLAVLGALNKSHSRGGIKLDAVHTTRGAGLGGVGGSGGIQTSIYSKGLIAAPLGPNDRAQGSGGYGKRGAGGGEAGYGKLSMVGSSTAFFQPVLSDTVIEGGLDSAQIAEVIQRHLGQIRYCYEQGLQSRPELSGRVAIKFAINSQGVVSQADVTNSSLHSGPVESCLISRLKTWAFPRPRGGVIVKVNYPFVLKRISQG